MQGGDWKFMFHAVEQNDVDSVEYYLSQGVDPDYQHPEYLESALVESIRLNHLDIAKMLLEHGADPLIKEVWGGATPLSVAKSQKNKAAKELIQSYIK